MSSTSQTGHAKNVANYGALILKVTNLGEKYNPFNKNILKTALSATHAAAVAILASIHALFAPWIIAVNNREEVFSPLDKLFTRVSNATKSSGLSPLFIKDVQTVIRKLQGRRATPKIVPPKPADGSTPEIPDEKTISASQKDFDSRIENMDKLIQLLKAQPEYTPNEPDLTVDSLSALLLRMQTVNTAAIDSYNPLNTARIQRDEILYDETTGLVHQASEVKAYVSSVFGASSPAFKDINKLRFKNLKKK